VFKDMPQDDERISNSNFNAHDFSALMPVESICLPIKPVTNNRY